MKQRSLDILSGLAVGLVIMSSIILVVGMYTSVAQAETEMEILMGQNAFMLMQLTVLLVASFIGLSAAISCAVVVRYSR